MSGRLRFARKDAVALPLTPETVEAVIARTRSANLAQLGLWGLAVAGLVWAGQRAGVPLAGLFYGAASLAMWGLLAAALSTWDHFRTATSLRGQAGADLAHDPDPATFWRAHRGLFPYFSR